LPWSELRRIRCTLRTRSKSYRRRSWSDSSTERALNETIADMKLSPTRNIHARLLRCPDSPDLSRPRRHARFHEGQPRTSRSDVPSARSPVDRARLKNLLGNTRRPMVERRPTRISNASRLGHFRSMEIQARSVHARLPEAHDIPGIYACQ